MSAGEKILDSISSASGPIGKLGELWMILTDLTIFFHTREFGKSPVIALLSRKEIKLIKYDQHANGVTLTFIPVNHPKNTIRVPFPKIQRTQINKFCEELAKTIPFELGSGGERTASYPPAVTNPTQSHTLPKNPGDSRSSHTPMSSSPGIGAPVAAPSTSAEKTKIKLAKPETQHSESTTKNTVQAAPAIGEKGTQSKAPLSQEGAFKSDTSPRIYSPKGDASAVKIVKEQGSAEQIESDAIVSDGPDFKYAVIATFISVLVGFLWFQVFKSIESK